MSFPRVMQWALLVSACLAPAVSASPPARPVPPAADTAAHPGPHWAYQPLANPEPPAVQNTRWAQSPIDRFVLAPLEAAGQAPAADADPATLARRLAFDLTGLPPTPEELAAFVEAARRDRAAAVAALVDRLLASPRFGEHWGRHWLDVARFGESVTLRGFVFREAWRYRDYVIDAFNEDRPFHEFVREQIAGDLLSSGSDPLPVRQRRLIATTFLALGNTNLEEQDKGQLDLDVVDEQLDTLGKAFLGQTLGCARCHDHKFDPIPTRDYYAMAGILRNARLLKHANVSEWLETPLPVSPEEEAALQRHEAAVAGLEAELKHARATAKTGKGGPGSPATAAVLDPADLPGLVIDSRRARTVGEWKHSTQSGRYIGDGYWQDLNRDKGSKTLSFAPEHLPAGRYEVRLAYIPSANRATNVPVTVFHADGETVVTVNQRLTPEIQGRFAVLGRFRFESNGFANVLVGTEQTRGHVTVDAVQFLPLDAADAAPLAAPAGDGADARLASLEARLRELRAQGPRRPMVMTVREVAQPADGTIQVRGEVHNPGAVVPRGFLSATPAGATPSIPAGQSGRRQLADWLASADHPLTARVYVNRVWAWLVGEGLVQSVDNFGTTGDSPTHPELLDYLARRFMADGGSTKRLIREIVLSRTYQMASAPAAAPEAGLDPDNRRLARAFRKRLRAEQLRDAMLAISGRLDLNPPRGPTFPRERTADYGFVATSPQRSVYLPVFRNALPEIFETFDFAPTSLVTGRRQESIVPTQALFLLNHPFIREQAGHAARRLLAATAAPGTASDAARLRRAWEQTLGRPPTPAETALARRHLADLDPAEAWTELYHALFAHADFRQLD